MTLGYRVYTAATLTVVVVGGVACTQDSDNAYYPRPRDGTRWEYKLDTVVPNVGVVRGKLVVRVDGTETIKDRTYFRLTGATSGLPGAEPQLNFYRWSPDGVFSIDGKEKDNPEDLALPSSPAVGDTWKGLTEPGGMKAENRIVAVEDLQLFDRKYDDCLKVSSLSHIGGDPIEIVLYYARGIGVVKSTTQGGGVTMERTLEKFEY